MAVVEPHEAAQRAAAGHGVPQIPGGGVRALGGVDDGAFAVATPRSGVSEAREPLRYTLVSPARPSVRRRRRGWPWRPCCGPARAGCPGGWEAARVPGARPGCVPEAGDAGAGRGGPASGRERPPPVGEAATEQDGDGGGLDRVVCGLPAMDGRHGEGRTEDERAAVSGAEVGEPVPGAPPCDRDNGPVSISGPWLSQRSRGLSSGCGVARSRRAGPGGRQTWSARAQRCRSKRGAAACTIALSLLLVHTRVFPFAHR